MAYTVKTTGSASFYTVDLRCNKCDFTQEGVTADLRGSTEEEKEKVKKQLSGGWMSCPVGMCDGHMEKVFLKAPSFNKIGADGSDSQIAAFKHRCKEEFVRNIDDTRHKHGRLLDDSLISGAVNRIKKGEDPI